MIRYKVGHGTNVFIDQCGTCNGVWFDKNEWSKLREASLHNSIAGVFTQFWQLENVRDEFVDRNGRFYEDTLGAEVYREVQRIKKWIEGHPKSSLIMAYLIEKDQ